VSHEMRVDPSPLSPFFPFFLPPDRSRDGTKFQSLKCEHEAAVNRLLFHLLRLEKGSSSRCEGKLPTPFFLFFPGMLWEQGAGRVEYLAV